MISPLAVPSLQRNSTGLTAAQEPQDAGDVVLRLPEGRDAPKPRHRGFAGVVRRERLRQREPGEQRLEVTDAGVNVDATFTFMLTGIYPGTDMYGYQCVYCNIWVTVIAKGTAKILSTSTVRFILHTSHNNIYFIYTA
jgi:hypothetical protein